jgi:undecaprenyl-diphosphatase
MTIIHSLILGIIEGISEFLPISSTGHLILTSDLLKISQSDFLKSFEIIIQLGAILAVIVLYWRSFFNLEVWKKTIAAFIPTGIIGLILYKIVKTYLIGNEKVVLWSLLLGGIFLIIFELLYKKSNYFEQGIESITYKQAFVIGIFQSIAIIPGVSRSAATIIGGLLLGLKRKTIVEFSFLLAVPTMIAASGLDLVKNASSFSTSQFWFLAAGFISAFAVAIASIKFLLSYVQKHNFIPFGIYRILVSLVFWLK